MSIGETPFNFINETDAMIPVEVGEPTVRRQLKDFRINDGCLET